MLQSLVGHHRSEVGTADADIDDVTNTLAGVTPPFPATEPVGEIRHPVEDGMHLGHHVLAVHYDGRISRRAQGRVQYRALLRDVDFFSAKHSVDSFSQARFLGEPDQQIKCFTRDAILRVVEKQAQSLYRQPLATLWIICKELSQM